MYGILSVGCITALAATHKYVPGVAPAVAALMAAVKSLNFGPRNAPRINYRSTYAPFLEALSNVYRHDLIFDIKEVINEFVQALNRTGPRSVVTWDDNLLAALRLKNRLLQSQFAVRADLNNLIRELAVMKRYQEEFELLRADDGSEDTYAAMTVRAQPAGTALDAYEDVLNVYRVGEAPGRGWATRPCKRGEHPVPQNSDFCGQCGEFFDDIICCPICNTPARKAGKTKEGVQIPQFCRSWFNLVPCNAKDEDVRGT